MQLTSLAVAAVTAVLCADILHWMQTPDVIFHDAWLYLLITFLGIPFTMAYNLLASIIRALGDSRTPFYFLILSAVLNVALDLLFVPVLGMGVGGTMDVISGNLTRAPKAWQKCGMEWLYRVIQEPSRWRRIAKLPLFVWYLILTCLHLDRYKDDAFSEEKR